MIYCTDTKEAQSLYQYAQGVRLSDLCTNGGGPVIDNDFQNIDSKYIIWFNCIIFLVNL